MFQYILKQHPLNMSNMAFKYLPKEVLVGFDKYKYNAVDTSPLSKYVTHPFWNWFVQFYPKWVPANALTFGGFLLLVLEFGVFTYYDNNFYASDDSHPEYPPVPIWVWMLAANCMFWAHTLDGTDGKQARRTNCTGPLGELFDHGLDSWATLYMPLGMYDVFGRGSFSLGPHRVLFILMGVMFTFAISHWEKYNTGVLYLPWGYDISQIAMAIAYVITFFGGHSVWNFMVPYTNLHAGNLFEIVMHMSVFAFSIPVSLYNVYHGYKSKTGKGRSFYQAMRPLIPVFVLFLLFTVWMCNSSYDIVRKEPRLFYFAMGNVFSNITCRLIVNCMSDTLCQVFNWLLVPLMAIVAGVLTLHLGTIELYLLWAYFIFVLAAHIHYGICVVQQLADHFNIYVFSTQKPPPRKNKAE